MKTLVHTEAMERATSFFVSSSDISLPRNTRAEHKSLAEAISKTKNLPGVDFNLLHVDPPKDPVSCTFEAPGWSKALVEEISAVCLCSPVSPIPKGDGVYEYTLRGYSTNKTLAFYWFSLLLSQVAELRNTKAGSRNSKDRYCEAVCKNLCNKLIVHDRDTWDPEGSVKLHPVDLMSKAYRDAMKVNLG